MDGHRKHNKRNVTERMKSKVCTKRVGTRLLLLLVEGSTVGNSYFGIYKSTDFTSYFVLYNMGKEYAK